MTDASTFGGGLAAPIGGGTGGGADVPSPPGAPLSLAPPDPGTLPPATAPQPSALHSFGQGLNTLLNGPNYTPPDPQATALDQTADTLQQRIQRANSVATNPILQFFNPEGVQKARDFVPQATEQLQKIKQQQQQQADIQKAATNFGVPKSAQNPMMTNDTIDNYLLDQYKSGDFTAAKSLQARGKGEWVQDFAAAALDGAGAKLKAADTAATKLSAANGNQAAYNAARKSLTPEDIKALSDMGMQNIPDKATEWQGVVAKHGAMFQQAQQLHAQTVQKLTNMTNFDQSAPKEVGESIAANVTLGNTNEPAFGGNNVKIRTMDGQPGVTAPNGSVQTARYGLSSKDGGWNAWNPEREKTFQSYTNDENVKGSLNQYNMMNKVRDTLTNEDNYRSSAGLTAIKDELGTMRDVAEKSAASGSIGFTKMFGMSQGVVETTLNKAANEWGALQNWLASGKKADAPGAPRMERDTIAGLKQLSQHMYDYAATEAKGRLGGAMTYAGRGGKPLDEIPLDAALKAELAPFHEQGRIEAINGYNAHPSLVTGNQRVFFPQGSNVQGATPPRAPVQQDTQPASAPGAPGGSPAGPTSPAPGALQPPGPGPAGGGTPVTVAGQQVSFTPPPGVSPTYLASAQHIESGNEKSPWTAGTANSSASGAYQMIDSTWAANKPPGATATRAKDATPQQQTQAMETLTAKNAASLKTAGLPVNDTNLYVAHNLGSAGASALLRADPNADARTVVGAKAAANNPLFFKGKPTAATVLARYQANMAQDISDTVPRGSGAGGATSTLPDVGAAAWTGRTTPAGDRIATPEERAASPVVENAPAIGSTIGAMGGAASPVPGGMMLGGGAGGAAGQSFKDYMQGRPQDPEKIAKQGALGAVLGIAPEGAPLLGAAARVAGVAGVEGGVAAAEGGSTEDVAAAAVKGGAYALGGEALGRFVSMGGAQAYKALSRYTTTAQAELSASAGKLAEARAVLETEQPKLPGEAAGANPKYEAAKKAEEAATQAIKDHGQNPDDMVHAYEQAKAGTSAGEAAIMRKPTAEKGAVSQGYDDLRGQVRDAGVGAPKPNQPVPDGPVPDGPVAQLRTADNPTGKVPEQFRPEAEHAEMLIKAPAKDFGAKWQQLQSAGTELIQKRMSFLQNADKPSADAMDNLFQGVRAQQKAVAEYVFGPERGAKIIANLENLDTRYAKVMNATQGMKYEKMRATLAAGNTPEARELTKNFTEFAKGDPSAMRAFNAMKAGARGDWKSEAALMGPVIAGEVAANLHGVPTVGAISAIVGGHRLYKMVQGYMNARILGKAVTFKDFLANEIKPGVPQVAATVAQRGTTMQ